MSIPTPWLKPHLTDPREVTLAPRQAAVLFGIAAGLSNADIADRMFVTENTVKIHVRRMFAALGASNRAHAAALAMSGQVTVYVRDNQQEKAA